MDLKRMLKVYNYVNDDKRPKVSVKFLGMLAAFLVVGGLLVAFALTNPSPAGPSVGGEDAAAAQKSDAIRLTDVEQEVYALNPALQADIIDARLDNWIADHPDAEIHSIERAYNDDGLWIGYDITYSE